MPATAVPAAPPLRPQGPASNAAARSAGASRPNRPWRGKSGPRRGTKPRGGANVKGGEAEHEILFQKFFKSVGPRTYAAQVKRASNGNHYLVLMEGKRDESGEVRKTRLFVYSEDFVEFFRLIKSAAEFIKSNPLPPDVLAKREKFWAKQAIGAKPAAPGPAPVPPRRGAVPART